MIPHLSCRRMHSIFMTEERSDYVVVQYEPNEANTKNFGYSVIGLETVLGPK